MTKFEMLKKGLKEIAKNHGFNANVEDDNDLCIYGGMNVPTLGDVYMLCEDLGISRDCIETCEGFGVDIYVDEEWYTAHANETYKKTLGMEMWRRVC